MLGSVDASVTVTLSKELLDAEDNRNSYGEQYYNSEQLGWP